MIRLTTTDGQTVYLNTALISSIREVDSKGKEVGGTEIQMSVGTLFRVRQMASEILERGFRIV